MFGEALRYKCQYFVAGDCYLYPTDHVGLCVRNRYMHGADRRPHVGDVLYER